MQTCVYGTRSTLFEKKTNNQKTFKEAKREAEKDLAKEKNIQEEKLKGLINKSSRPILKISTVFPFDLFPDDVIIDFHKVSIVYREFFFSESVYSLGYKDIGDVLIETNPFFATLRITNRMFTQSPLVIKYLKKREALCARRIIQGLIIVGRENIDLSQIGEDHLAETIEEIGKTLD